LNKLDAKINGWVIEGYPSSSTHLEKLKSFGVKPSHVFCLEISDSRVYERLEHRRFDPQTGVFYNTETHPPDDLKVVKRLIQNPEDSRTIV